MLKTVKTWKWDSGRPPPPPCFFKIPTFSLFFLAMSLNRTWYFHVLYAALYSRWFINHFTPFKARLLPVQSGPYKFWNILKDPAQNKRLRTKIPIQIFISRQWPHTSSVPPIVVLFDFSPSLHPSIGTLINNRWLFKWNNDGNHHLDHDDDHPDYDQSHLRKDV